MDDTRDAVEGMWDAAAAAAVADALENTKDVAAVSVAAAASVIANILDDCPVICVICHLKQ